MGLCREQIKLRPDAPGPFYNLACAQARLNLKTQALQSLEQAARNGYSDDEHMQTDSDLESLRDDPAFAKLLEAVKSHRQEIQKKEQEAAQIARQLPAMFRQKDYVQAQSLCEKLTKLQPADPGHWYNLAVPRPASTRRTRPWRLWPRPGNWVTPTPTSWPPTRTSRAFGTCRPSRNCWTTFASAAERLFGTVSQRAAEIEGVRTLEGQPEGGLLAAADGPQGHRRQARPADYLAAPFRRGDERDRRIAFAAPHPPR